MIPLHHIQFSLAVINQNVLVFESDEICHLVLLLKNKFIRKLSHHSIFFNNTCDIHHTPSTRRFKYDRDCLCVNLATSVPVIFEPPCIIPLKGNAQVCGYIQILKFLKSLKSPSMLFSPLMTLKVSVKCPEVGSEISKEYLSYQPFMVTVVNSSFFYKLVKYMTSVNTALLDHGTKSSLHT